MDNDILYGATNQFNFPELPNSRIILSEKVLQKLILEDIESFLDELGTGFTFIKSEYPIKMGNTYNYIDLLLYNIKYRNDVLEFMK